MMFNCSGHMLQFILPLVIITMLLYASNVFVSLGISGRDSLPTSGVCSTDFYSCSRHFINELQEQRSHFLRNINHLAKDDGVVGDNNLVRLSEGGLDYYDVSSYPWIQSLVLLVPNTLGLDYNVENITTVDVSNVIADIRDLTLPIRDLYPVYLDSESCRDLQETVTLPVVPSCDRVRHLEITRIPLPVDDVTTQVMFRFLSRVSVHVVADALVSEIGLVYSRGVQLVPLSCLKVSEPPASRAGLSTLPTFGDVFLLSQFWSYGYYHWVVEALPRVTPFLVWLLEKPGIKIHVLPSATHRGSAFIQEYLEMLGISRYRLVHGRVKGRLVYLPQGGACGAYANPLLIQVLAKTLNTILQQREGNYNSSEEKLSGQRGSAYTDVNKQTKMDPAVGKYGNTTHDVHATYARSRGNLIILIQRTRDRGLIQHDIISNLLNRTAAEHELGFLVFSDHSLPPLHVTAEFFRRAALVVAPHGAGLANLIFSRPPVSVLEILCAGQRKKLNYVVLAKTLGHRYFGIKATSGCFHGMKVDITKIKEIVDYVMKN